MSYERLKAGGLKDRLKILFHDAALYGVAGAISQFLKLFTVPFITRFYSKSDFGAIDGITVFGTLFIPLAFWGLDSAIARFYYETDDKREKAIMLFQGLIVGTVLCVLTTVALYAGSGLILRSYLHAVDYESEYRIMVASIPFLYWSQYFSTVLRWTFRRRAYLWVNYGVSVATIALTFVFVVVLRQPVISILTAQLIARVIFSFIGFQLCRDLMAVGFSSRQLMEMLRFGTPFMLVSFLGTVLPAIDRYVIAKYCNLEALAIYGFAARLVTAIHLLNKCFQLAWGPLSMALYRDAGAGELYGRVLNYSTAALCISNMGLVAFESPLIHLLGSVKYIDSASLVPILGHGIVIMAMTGITATNISLAKRPEYFLFGYLAGIGVSFLLMTLLVKLIGLPGVGLGLFAGQASMMIVLHRIGQKLYALKMAIARPLLYVIVSGLLSWGVSLLVNRGWFVQGTAGLCGLIFLACLTVWLLMDMKDRSFLRARLRLMMRIPAVMPEP